MTFFAQPIYPSVFFTLRLPLPLPPLSPCSLLEQLVPLEAELGRHEVIINAELLMLQMHCMDDLKALEPLSLAGGLELGQDMGVECCVAAQLLCMCNCEGEGEGERR